MLRSCIGWLGLLALALGCDAGPSVDPRPDIVVLIADDLASGTVGAAGDPHARTPRLDALAAEGVRFENAFVTTSLCTPARASYLTGQYVRQHGVVGNASRFPAGAVTYASQLRSAGYETGYVGKWHTADPAEPRPGFDWTASFAGQGRYRDADFFVGDADRGEIRTRPGHVDEASTDLAIGFVERERRAPMLLVVGYKALHVPREVPPRFEGLFADAEIAPPPNFGARPPFPRRDELDALSGGAADGAAETLPDDWAARFDRASFDPSPDRVETLARKYYRSLAALDAAVGRLLDVLARRERANRTIVVLVGDNGSHRYEHGMVGKRSAYEASMGVEMLVRAPGAPPGTRRDELVLDIDLAPSLLALASAAPPASMQGRSWVPLLRGEPAPDWRDAFVYEYYRAGFAYLPTIIALRTRTEKLVTYPGHPHWTELFDLDEDPWERRNLARTPARRDRITALERRLAALERELGPRLLDR